MPARSSVPIGESEALCVGQASSTISARTMMASKAIEMRRRGSSDRTPSVAAGPNVDDSLLSAGPLLRIAEDVQLAEGVYVPRTAWSTLWARRFRPLRIAWADQPWGVEALLTTNSPVLNRGA